MNELSTTAKQLPDNLEDLTRFTLIGREKLNAVRAEIRAIEKVGLAKEVHEQKLQEAQEIAEAVLDAEAKIGELTSKMQKAQGFASNIKDSSVPNVTKQKQLEQIGISEKQKQRFETLARHPQAVERAKADARAEGRIVTRQDVFHDIASTEYPSRRQKEERELREAKKRAENFENSKVVAIGEAKQNKDDNKLIFEEFSETVHKATMAILHMAIKLDEKTVTKAIKATSNEELKKVLNDLQENYKTILKVQRKIVEVIDEKQS